MKSELHIAKKTNKMNLQEVLALIPEPIRPEMIAVDDSLSIVLTDSESGFLIWNNREAEDSMNIRFVLAEVLEEKIYSKMFRFACMCCPNAKTYMKVVFKICKKRGIKKLYAYKAEKFQGKNDEEILVQKPFATTFATLEYSTYNEYL